MFAICISYKLTILMTYRMFVKYIPWIPHLRYILLKKTPSVLMHINCYKEYVQFKFKHYPCHILLHVVVCQYCTKILFGGENSRSMHLQEALIMCTCVYLFPHLYFLYTSMVTKLGDAFVIVVSLLYSYTHSIFIYIRAHTVLPVNTFLQS